MDGRSNYAKVTTLLKDYQGAELTIGALKKLIAKNIGSTETTISRTMKLMLEFSLITETSPFIFEVQ